MKVANTTPKASETAMGTRNAASPRRLSREAGRPCLRRAWSFRY